jgi:hypothetical protein
VDGFDMGILLALICPGRYHSQEGMYACHGEAAGGAEGKRAAKRRGSDGNDALHAGVKPHHTNAAEPLFRRDANQGEGVPIEGMGGVSDCHRIGG